MTPTGKFLVAYFLAMIVLTVIIHEASYWLGFSAPWPVALLFSVCLVIIGVIVVFNLTERMEK